MDRLSNMGSTNKMPMNYFWLLTIFKGQADTLGYPQIGRYSALICKMFDAIDDPAAIPPHAIKIHIDAVKVCIREKIKDQENNTANQVLERLQQVVLEFCAHHKKPAKQTKQKQSDKPPGANPNSTPEELHELAASVGAVIAS